MSRVRHLVAFRVPEKIDVERVIEILGTFSEMDGVASARVERDLGVHPPAYQVLLVTEHESVDELARFRRDPAHTAAAEKLTALADSRVTVDHSITG